MAIAVRSTEEALGFFRDRLGLEVVCSEEIHAPRVRLTYLDCGNAYLQLVEPLDGETEIARCLEQKGEGLHHICFSVDDVEGAARALADDASMEVRLGSGRGRASAFVPGTSPHGVRIECTEFSYADDVELTPGWLTGSGDPQAASSGSRRRG